MNDSLDEDDFNLDESIDDEMNTTQDSMYQDILNKIGSAILA